ncbi:hypothetical protein Prudu_006481 [Prunus dulcis]|uniref:Uncharacterized protein n=1 Tax=Prunus dulcis TaxID=3755 RepID=A0A4Y1QZW8_PRUDU|nr:hypothetical protein Prudu_006481 [Prunus dulcis]
MYVSRGVGYPALRQAPYVALVVPAYGEIVRYCVEVARGVGINFGKCPIYRGDSAEISAESLGLS